MHFWGVYTFRRFLGSLHKNEFHFLLLPVENSENSETVCFDMTMSKRSAIVHVYVTQSKGNQLRHIELKHCPYNDYSYRSESEITLPQLK